MDPNRFVPRDRPGILKHMEKSRHPDARTTLRYLEYPPPPALHAHTECLWMVWDSARRARRPPDRVVPDGCPELIIHLADCFSRQHGRRWVRQPRAFLAGALTRPWLVRGGPRLRTLGIRFRPGSVTRWFDVDMKRTADREVPLDRLIGRGEARALLARLDRVTTQGGIVRLAERWLLARPVRAEGPGDEAARAGVRKLIAGRGRTRIAALADQLGVSPRQLERGFARNLGLRPKLFARIVRLHAALALLAAEDRIAAVDWALEAGYFDQAHLARDFRVVAGRPARSGGERDGELARHFTAPKRLLAFLSGE